MHKLKTYNMEEIWKDIDNTNGLVQVSNMGSIRRKVNNNYKLSELRIPKQPKIKGNKIYKMISINGVNLYIHRLVAICFIPNPQNKHEVNHIDFNTLNNRADNLEWVTSKENKLHSRVNMSKAKQGENHPSATVSDITAINIKSDRKNGFKYKQLMDKYNLPQHTIANVCTRYYKHLNSKL